MRATETADLAFTVDIAASAERVWAALVDWESQGEWMLATDVRAVDGANAVGGRIEAFTGLLPKRRILGFLDTMTITTWEPPFRCDVLHTGRVVRGTGAFVVEAVDDRSSRFHWSEQVILPFGRLGRVGWIFVGPMMGWGVRFSLGRLARHLRAQ
jgi:hypothetical protein